MYEVLNAIANGMKGAYAYREDEEYMDQNTEEYNIASNYLNDLILHYESSLVMREEI